MGCLGGVACVELPLFYGFGSESYSINVAVIFGLFVVYVDISVVVGVQVESKEMDEGNNFGLNKIMA